MSKFYRGKSTLFDVSKHGDGLYFATDINELYVGLKDGSSRVYGSKEIITNVAFDSENAKLILTYRDNVIPVKNENEEITGYTNIAEVSLASLVNPVINEATQDESGLMSASDKANLDTLVAAYENNELGKVQGIAEDDKILDLSEEGILSATVSLSYDEDSKTIKLVGKDGASLGSVDANPFIKDGMLQDVEIVTDEETGKKYLEFTWNVTIETEVEGEKVETTKTDRIALEEIVITYTAGNGIEISDTNEISVKAGSGIKVDENGVSVKLAEGTNFLNCNNDGLSMSEITTDATKLQKEITVAGLNGTFGTGNYKNGDKIPAGTNIYDILVKILSQEIYPSDAKMSNAGNLTSKFSAPSFTLDSSGTTVEVGTKVNVTGVTGYVATPTKTSRQYSGFTNGWSLKYNTNSNGEQAAQEGNEADYSNTLTVTSGNPENVSFPTEGDDAVVLNTGTYTLTRTYSGFGKTDDNKTQEVTVVINEGGSHDNINETLVIAAEEDLVVASGTNKVTYKIEGPGHKGSIPASPKYYVVSNLGNAKSNLSVAAQDKKDFSVASATAGSAEKTVTGAYYNMYQVVGSGSVKDMNSSSKSDSNSIAVDKIYKTFGTVEEINITANTVSKVVILSKSKTVTAAEWISAGFSQDWIGNVTVESSAVDFELPDKTTVKYNKITIVASSSGDMFGTDGTLKLTY